MDNPKCAACGRDLARWSLNFYPRNRDGKQQTRYDGKVARFCRECRPQVKRVYMRLTRQGVPVTWSREQVDLVRLEGDR